MNSSFCVWSTKSGRKSPASLFPLPARPQDAKSQIQQRISCFSSRLKAIASSEVYDVSYYPKRQSSVCTLRLLLMPRSTNQVFNLPHIRSRFFTPLLLRSFLLFASLPRGGVDIRKRSTPAHRITAVLVGEPLGRSHYTVRTFRYPNRRCASLSAVTADNADARFCCHTT